MDEAWSYLQNNDKIEKLIPLVPLAIGAGFGALGAYTGAGGRFQDDEGKLDLNFGGEAGFQDPVTGGLIFDVGAGDSTAARIGGGAFGALQGLNPATGIKAIGGGIKGLRSTYKAKKIEQAAEAGKAAEQAALAAGQSASQAKQAGILAEEAVLYPGVQNVQVAPGVIDSTRPLAARAKGVRGAAADVTARGLTRLGQNRLARFAGRAAQLYGQDQQHDFGGKLGTLAASLLAPKLPDADVDTGGFGTVQGSGSSNPSGFGATGSGSGGLGGANNMNNLSAQFSNRTAGQEIFNPNAFRGNRRAEAFESQKEFGGL
tara:strand:- start:1007 stop:1954 length:948 start_codon:yes stop_codon:yes gene_type:complete